MTKIAFEKIGFSLLLLGAVSVSILNLGLLRSSYATNSVGDADPVIAYIPSHTEEESLEEVQVSASWQKYTNEISDYTFEYPDGFTLETPDENTVRISDSVTRVNIIVSHYGIEEYFEITSSDDYEESRIERTSGPNTFLGYQGRMVEACNNTRCSITQEFLKDDAMFAISWGIESPEGNKLPLSSIRLEEKIVSTFKFDEN